LVLLAGNVKRIALEDRVRGSVGIAILLCATSAMPLAPVLPELMEDAVMGMVVSPAVCRPHSGPQSTTYAVEPSGEKTALMG